MTRLANSSRGLSPFALRQLYLACITSIADYGSAIWWRGQVQLKKPLQALQNLGLRKILGVFKTAPILPMEVEAALAPPGIRLNASIRQYAFRALRLAPSHPISLEIDQVFKPTESPVQVKNRPSQPTQLERIWNSIQGLVDLDSIELIQHFKYPPWNRSTPYTVKISELPKDEAALAHLADLQLGPSHCSIYTDTSSTPDENTTGIRIGLAIPGSSPTRPSYQTQSNIGPS